MLLNKTIKSLFIILTIILSLNLVSCDFIKNLKGGNNYFDYMQGEGIDEISIQNIRDKSFKFLVTDEKSIENIYSLLSNAKESDTRTEADPDYIVEIVFGEESKQFYYTVGDYEGNFYNDEVSFTVSKRIDESVIQNLSIIRKPRDFEYIYFNSILNIIDVLKGEIDLKNIKLGIDIQEDKDCLKYIFSKDISNFLNSAKKIAPNIEIVNNNSSDFDVIIKVKNRGHSTTEYKSNITVEDKVNKTEKYYYVLGENEYKEWSIDIYTDENIPKDVEKNW